MSFDVAIDAVADEMRDRSGGAVCVVAVDGHSAAGKSTFAAELARRLGAAGVHGDDFYRVMDDRERALLSAWEGIETYYDWQRMRVEALTVVRGGDTATFHPYDWDSGGLARRTVTVNASPVVVVEGLFVSRPELQDLVDLSVLVDTPVDVRWRRQLERADATPAWLERWDAAERLFFERVRPPSSFTIVVRETAGL